MLGQQCMKVVGPDDLLDLLAVERDAGGAGVPPVVEENPEALGGDHARELQELRIASPPGGSSTPPAGRQRHRQAVNATGGPSAPTISSLMSSPSIFAIGVSGAPVPSPAGTPDTEPPLAADSGAVTTGEQR